MVLQRCKAFNMCALVDFITNVFESYHKRHLLLFANSRSTNNEIVYMKFFQKAKDTLIQKVDDKTFFVSSSEDNTLLYTVDTDLSICDCPYGAGGKFCKHICAVQEKYGIIFNTSPRLTTHDKKIFAKLSLGQEVPEKFFESMDITDADTLQNVQNRDIEHNNVNLSQDCSEMPKQDNTELQAKLSAVLQKLDNNFKRLIQMVSEDCSPEVTNSLIKLNNVFFDEMQTPAQLTAFCYSAAKNRCPRQIGVQPGSITRRKIRPPFLGIVIG